MHTIFIQVTKITLGKERNTRNLLEITQKCPNNEIRTKNRDFERKNLNKTEKTRIDVAALNSLNAKSILMSSSFRIAIIYIL